MRTTTLKRTKKGFVRSIGKRADGTVPKFLLGHDKAVAEARRDAIIALWAEIEKRTGSVKKYRSGNSEAKVGGPYWSPAEEKNAKAIAKGENVLIAPAKPGDSQGYFEKIRTLV